MNDSSAVDVCMRSFTGIIRSGERWVFQYTRHGLVVATTADGAKADTAVLSGEFRDDDSLKPRPCRVARRMNTVD